MAVKIVKKTVISAVLLMAAAIFAVLPSRALSTDSYSAEYENFIDRIPEDIKGLLPEEISSEDSADMYDAAKEASEPENFLRMFLELFGFHIKDALRMFASLMGIVAVSALCRAMCEHTGCSGVGEAFSLCTGAVASAFVLGTQLCMVRSVQAFLERLSTLVNSIIPLVGVLYALGGNVKTAAAGTSSLTLFLAVCENICAGTLLPVVGVCLSFSAVSAFSPRLKIGDLSARIKKTYSFLLGLLMGVLALIMGTQTMLTSKADSVAARTAKYAASTFIPVVGGAVGDSLRTVAAGIEYIRASVGTLAIVILLLLLLPTLLSLFLGNTAIGFAASVAEMLGCTREGKLISELGNLYGYMIAVCSICSVMFIYALTLFIHCSAALAS